MARRKPRPPSSSNKADHDEEREARITAIVERLQHHRDRITYHQERANHFQREIERHTARYKTARKKR
jgi:hypothetical protein